jgi:uncharacterized phage protein (TIGR01671 family)
MNDRFNFRIWNKQENKYLDGIFAVARSGRLIIDLDILQDYDNPNDLIIEQCTGLKDKNGNLIYEGNVVKYYWDTKTTTGFICWNDDFAGFYIVNNEEHCIESPHCLMYVVNKKNIEIIGNIHEQAEQKDVK